jgi:2-dehydropantoate 2-reductase
MTGRRRVTRILVLGAGGVGGYYGGRLAEAGADVTFLVRTHRREQLRRDGLRITSPLGDLARPVQTTVAAELQPEYDVVLLTCKAYDLDSSMDAIAPAVAGDCTIVPLLNGLVHLNRLDQRFSADRVMGGTCGIDVMLLPDGTIRHTGPLQRIAFGERDRRRSARAQALADAFGRTSLEWEWADDILLRMWEKIVLLSALAATTCLFRGNVHEIMSAPGGKEATERALAANVEIARREGYPQSEQSVRSTHDRLTDPAGRWSASMMRDMESGRPVEADHIIGFMLDRARDRGVDDTILSLAYAHLKTYECRRAEGRLPQS